MKKVYDVNPYNPLKNLEIKFLFFKKWVYLRDFKLFAILV